MSKGGAQSKVVYTDLSAFSESSFSLTFAVELLGLDVWHDCNEGWLDLGPCVQGVKLQYQLYPGQVFDVDILIWPHVAKIWCGAQYGWVRTWQFLERRFITFSIHHLFPVRVADLRNYTAVITPTVGISSFGPNAKNDKNVEVYLPPLLFGQRRYFGTVIDREESLSEFIVQLIWNLVSQCIPATYLDKTFDVPGPVKDIRHQDAILYQVKESICNKNIEVDVEPVPNIIESRMKDKRESKVLKEKDKEKKKTPEVAKVKFELKLSGNAILAGVGRIVSFEIIGDRPPDVGEIIAVISSSNLPAQDDYPIIFVNIQSLLDAPLEHFENLRISKLYTRWTLGDEVHDSEPQNVKNKDVVIKFNDHYALPLEPAELSKVIASFLDNPFEIELRGIRTPKYQKDSKLFGYQRDDISFGLANHHIDETNDLDIIIAVACIDCRSLSKGLNMFIRGEYPLNPPRVSTLGLDRECICTNDINQIRMPIKPNLIVPPDVVLQAQMRLEMSLGSVGCKPRKITTSFGRMFCLVQHTESIMAVLREIAEINEICMLSDAKEESLTGFAIDVGNLVFLYVEGPSHGRILQVWEMTGIFYPKMKPLYSTSVGYSSRMYPERILGPVQFNVMKMFIPIGLILACPAVYARPALPLPTKSALLKIGRIISSKLRSYPRRSEMPTAAELQSFKLELCVAPKPVSVRQADSISASPRDEPANSAYRFSMRINGENNEN